MSQDLPERHRITLLMRLISQHYAQLVDAAMREAGFSDIRPGDAKVFPFVPPEGISIADLAEMAGVRKQTMGEAVEQLERSGYVERRPNPRDARSRLVFLSDRGRSVEPVARSAGDRAEDQWARLTSSSEVEALRSGLLRLAEAIHGQES